MTIARRLGVLAVTAATLAVLPATAASADSVGGGTYTIPAPGCSTNVTAPKVTYSVLPSQSLSGDAGHADASCA
jgi:hypothetical protein